MTNTNKQNILTKTQVIKNDNLVTETNLVDYMPLLLLPIAAAVTYHYSKRQLRKMKRKMLWQIINSKMFKNKKKLGVFWAILLYCSPLIIVLFLFNWIMGLILLGALLLAALFSKKS